MREDWGKEKIKTQYKKGKEEKEQKRNPWFTVKPISGACRC